MVPVIYHVPARIRYPTIHDLSSILGCKVKTEKTDKPKDTRDELQQYLDLDVDDMDLKTDVLKWWKKKEHQWPRLAKMVKQYFAQPASSAGPERVFSADGKMHDDLKKAAKDSSLEHSLFAMQNTE